MGQFLPFSSEVLRVYQSNRQNFSALKIKRPRLLNAQCLVVHQIWLKVATDLNVYRINDLTNPQKGVKFAYKLTRQTTRYSKKGS